MCILWCIAILLIIGYCIIIHPVICTNMILVSVSWCYMRGASCAAGVIWLFVHYLYIYMASDKTFNQPN